MYEYRNNEEGNHYYGYQGDNHPRRIDCSEVRVQKKSGGKKILTFALVAVLCGGLAAGSFFAVNTVLNTAAGADSDITAASEVSEVPSQETFEVDTVGASAVTGETPSASESTVKAIDVTDVVKQQMPCVVAITNKQIYENYMNGMFSRGTSTDSSGQEVDAGAGSGVIISETDDGYCIVTNYHVIDGASSLTATLVDESVVEAEVVGFDKDADLAILKISKDAMEDSTKNAVSVADMGDSSELEVGESVIAIGNALGYGQSVTTGIVSALDCERTVTNSDGTTSTRTLIQTDAAINPGNSGGALFDSQGNLIGINEMKYSSTSVEGVCYAIPINKVKECMSSLMEGEGVNDQTQDQQSVIPQQGEQSGNSGVPSMPDSSGISGYGQQSGGSGQQSDSISEWIEYFEQYFS